MKKSTAHDLHSVLSEVLSTNSADEWRLSPPEHRQDDRHVNYYLRLYIYPEDRDLVPTLPPAVVRVIDEYDLSHPYTFMRRLPTEEPVGGYPESDSYSVKGHKGKLQYDYIIDDLEYEELPRTAEEEQAVRLTDQLKDLFGLSRRAAKKVADNYDTLGEVLAASERELRQIDGIGERNAHRVTSRQGPVLRERLKEAGDDSTVIVAVETEDGVYEPLYTPDSLSTINKDLLRNL